MQHLQEYRILMFPGGFGPGFVGVIRIIMNDDGSANIPARLSAVPERLTKQAGFLICFIFNLKKLGCVGVFPASVDFLIYVDDFSLRCFSAFVYEPVVVAQFNDTGGDTDDKAKKNQQVIKCHDKNLLFIVGYPVWT